MTPRPLLRIFATFLLLSALSACGKSEQASAPPAPKEVSGDSIAEFCNMALTEHSGPKGQIFVKKRADPYWFASVRDAFAFVMLPEEPKDIAAIYVTDMAKAKNWDNPEPGTWTDARKAVFVIASRKRSGMGEVEAVPFSDKSAAQAFVAENGGRMVRFDEMPRDYILPNGDVAPSSVPAASAPASPNTTNDMGGMKGSDMKSGDMKNMDMKKTAP